MHQRAQAFMDRVATEYDLQIEVMELPEGTKTAQDAADAISCSLGQIVKSMAMTVDDELILVLTSGPNRVDESALANALGVDQSTVGPADPDTVKETLGWSIGGVPPFAHETTVSTYLDPDLLEYDLVWAGAGTPYAVFSIEPDTLGSITDATVITTFEEA